MSTDRWGVEEVADIVMGSQLKHVLPGRLEVVNEHGLAAFL